MYCFFFKKTHLLLEGLEVQIKENRRACTKYYHKPQLYILPKVQPPSLSLSLVFLYENLTKRRSVNLFQLSKIKKKKKKKKVSLSLSLWVAVPTTTTSSHAGCCASYQLPPPPRQTFSTNESATSSWYRRRRLWFSVPFLLQLFFFLLNIQTDPKKTGIALNLYYPLCFIRKIKRKKRLKLVIFVIFWFCFRLSSIYVLIF